MRRPLALLAAGVLALSLAAPAAAAPVQNPLMATWEIVCPAPFGTYTVTAKGVPGWPTDGGPGSTPVLLRAGTFYQWEGGAIVAGPFVWSAPPGLESSLVGPCMLHLSGGSTATFDFRADDAWFQIP